MNQSAIDLTLSVIAATVGMALSWPFWRDFRYWPVSHLAWQVYFMLGFVLSVYVFHAFIGALHTLFAHDELTRDDSPDGQRGKGGAP